jgi:oleandomycin transport system ATP-binding protein
MTAKTTAGTTTAGTTTTGTAGAVVARGLTKRFGATTAVDGADLTIPGGSVFGLLGPNGAGKTTVVSMLATLIEPDAGRATVLGYDVTAQAHQVRQLIGLTGQYASLDETLSGTENLVLIGRLTGASRTDARQRATTCSTCWPASSCRTRCSPR